MQQQKAHRNSCSFRRLFVKQGILTLIICLSMHASLCGNEKPPTLREEITTLQKQLKSIKKELTLANKKIAKQENQIELLKQEIRQICKWTFLGIPSFDEERS